MAARGKKISFTVSPWDFWSIVMSRENTLLQNIIGLSILRKVWSIGSLCSICYSETKEPVYKSVRVCRDRSIRKL